MTTNPEQVAQVHEWQQPIIVGLPSNVETGLTLAGCWDDNTQQKLQYVAGCQSSSSINNDGDVVGLYVDSIRFHDLRLTIRQIQSVEDLHHVLRQTMQLPKRNLVLSKTPPQTSPYTHREARLKSCRIYQYDIPSHETNHHQQHFTLEGFPPQIRSLHPSSPLNIVLRSGLYVIALHVPQPRYLILEDSSNKVLFDLSMT